MGRSLATGGLQKKPLPHGVQQKMRDMLSEEEGVTAIEQGMKRKTTAYQVPYGKGLLEFRLPSTMRGTVVSSRQTEPLSEVEESITWALANPINSPPLRELARPSDRVCIVFTDVTRACPDYLLVPALLGQLEAVGVPDDHITLICALGMHRPSTQEERITKLGRAVFTRYRVLDHEPLNPRTLWDLGTTEGGIPLSVNRIAYESDLLIATGIVEPHQYAGYSGGSKTVAIGAAGETTIARTHGPQMVDHPGTRLGKIEGNLFHEAVREGARRAGLRFVLNVVQDEHARPVAILAGEPEATFLALVKTARKLYEVPISRRYDVVVAGVGFPKDANIYQASRAASYLFFAPTCVVKEGGIIIVPAPTPEGAGVGIAERRFFEKMHDAGDMSSLLSELRRTGYPPGAQRAYVMAKVLEKVHVIIAGSRTPDVVRQMHMHPAHDMDEALRIAVEKAGRDDLGILIVPHALMTLPILLR